MEGTILLIGNNNENLPKQQQTDNIVILIITIFIINTNSDYLTLIFLKQRSTVKYKYRMPKY